MWLIADSCNHTLAEWDVACIKLTDDMYNIVYVLSACQSLRNSVATIQMSAIDDNNRV